MTDTHNHRRNHDADSCQCFGCIAQRKVEATPLDAEDWTLKPRRQGDPDAPHGHLRVPEDCAHCEFPVRAEIHVGGGVYVPDGAPAAYVERQLLTRIAVLEAILIERGWTGESKPVVSDLSGMAERGQS